MQAGIETEQKKATAGELGSQGAVCSYLVLAQAQQLPLLTAFPWNLVAHFESQPMFND